jgi:hypothetical protein
MLKILSKEFVIKAEWMLSDEGLGFCEKWQLCDPWKMELKNENYLNQNQNNCVCTTLLLLMMKTIFIFQDLKLFQQHKMMMRERTICDSVVGHKEYFFFQQNYDLATI